MNKFFKKSYQSLLISGIIATLLGIVLFFMQNDFIETLIKWTGFVFIVMGATYALIDIYNISKKRNWGVFLFSGIILITLGILFTVNPTGIRNFLAYVLGIWAIISGAYSIIILLKFRKNIQKAFISVISGIFLIVIGFIFLFRPEILNPISNAIKYLLGALFLVVGLWKIFNSFRLKKIIKSIVLEEEKAKHKVNTENIEEAQIEKEDQQQDSAKEENNKSGFSSTSDDSFEYENNSK
ncbi:MAG: HdeD family acid-resistance protein [Bacteroidales bacterium]|jgi:uncharacterized membrane protein HdeD (DUF308 family)